MSPIVQVNVRFFSTNDAIGLHSNLQPRGRRDENTAVTINFEMFQ